MNIVFNLWPFESRGWYLTNRHLGKGRRAKWMEKVKGQRDGGEEKMKKRKIYVDGMQNGVTGGNYAIYIT